MPECVELREVEPGIVQLTMQERCGKNTFTEELVRGLVGAFSAIDAHPGYKVVIITGYDSYFASGGNQQGLLSLHEGRMRFTDVDVYSLSLTCKIPVIAAMQGHAIGGGFVMGLFADFVILSRESVYTCNFMKYGFTPGMGATAILPRKLGTGLAQEMLLGAGSYRGAELEKRGIPFPVVPRCEVLQRALLLAREVAEKPRLALVTLKEHLAAPIRQELPATVAQELAMHEKTFHQPEVKARILELFGS